MRLVRRVAALMFLTASAYPARAADKTDIVVLNNGDRITCEIVRLERGRLTVKTDPLDTITAHWGDVVSMTSIRTFEVENASGVTYYGSLKAGDRGVIVIVSAQGETTLQLLEVVRISPLERGFWRRLNGGIDLGFSFTQASEQTQWFLNANAKYRTERLLTQAAFSSQFTTIEGADATSRNTVAISTRRLLGQQWFSQGFAQFQQDQSLGLDFRSVLGGAGGRYLVHRPQTMISLFSGVAYTHEQFADVTGEDLAEALLGADWEWFTIGNNDRDLSSTLYTYYSLSGPARARIELNTSSKQKVVKDLYWSVNFFESHDTAPPEGQKANDFGASVSFGWSF